MVTDSSLVDDHSTPCTSSLEIASSAMSSKSGHLALLKYANDQWIAVVESGRESTISSQALVSSDDGFPHDRVKKLIELGKRIVYVRAFA